MRLDGGTADTGAEISAYFDSMLVKLTCRGRDFAHRGGPGTAGAGRVPDPRRQHQHPVPAGGARGPDFVAGDVSTAFIEQRPRPADHPHTPADRGTKLLRWLAEVTVNQPHGSRRPTTLDPGSTSARPGSTLATAASPPARGSGCSELGTGGFRRRPAPPRVGVEVTDTTFRDAHQSLLATRVRTKDLLRIAPYVGRMTPELLVVECWGGATYDVALRFLQRGPVGAAGRAALQHARASACRCCCGAATPWATPRTRPR